MHRTTYTVAVLSEEPIPETLDLAGVLHEADTGEYVADIDYPARSETLSRGQMAEALIHAGSTPDFFEGLSASHTIAGSTAPNENGWHRTAVWEAIDAGMGDDAVGFAYEVGYEKVNSNQRGSIAYYVEPSILDPKSTDPRKGTFAVMCAVSTWEVREDDDSHGHDTDYDHGDARCFDTVKSAEEQARRLALQDESHVFLS